MSRKQWKNRKAGTGNCRECGTVLTARKTVERGLCRSCWRVHRLVTR